METAVARTSLSHGSALRMLVERTIDITESAHAIWIRAQHQFSMQCRMTTKWFDDPSNPLGFI
ncbi:hypothetical protein GCM10025785_11440 [Corynebacterium canis]